MANEEGLSPAEQLAKSRSDRKQLKKKTSESLIWKCEISTIRKGLGLTLLEVCKSVKLSHRALRQIEAGFDLRLSTAYRIAEFYGKSVSDLWVRLPVDG